MTFVLEKWNYIKYDQVGGKKIKKLTKHIPI